MNCANHPDVAAVAFCRTCGKPLCQICQRPAQGTLFCEEHAPVPAGMPAGSATAENAPLGGASTPPPPPPPGAQPYSPYTQPYAPLGGDPSVSPGLAFLLGFIPGVGAIYNGQYAKGVVHVIVLGMIISIMNSGAAAGFEVLFGFLIPVWFFYMAFEAYHTAKRRQRGEPVDEFSSLFPMRAQGGFPIGPILLIGAGVLFLLNTLDYLPFYQIVKWWPLFLIALGAYMLFARISAGRQSRLGHRESLDEP